VITEQQNEQQIIERVLTGQIEQYSYLIDRYKQGLYLRCFHMVQDEAAAEDLVAASFERAYFDLKKYNPSYRYSTWLYKIATSLSLNYLKTNKHTIRFDPDLHDPGLQDTAGSDYDNRHRYTIVHDAIARLRPEYQMVIRLTYYENLKIEQISVMMNKPTGTIKGWHSRAKIELEKYLRKEQLV
jgi:RNA polymerase sigma-70 factor, ECF subfamily